MGEESSYFKPGKGLRQGDPISLLFNLVVDVLTRMLSQAADSLLIRDLLPKVTGNGIVLVQYADGTILSFDGD